MDFNIQYAELDQFDAYQKACMEMTYRYIVINILFQISTYLFYPSKSAEYKYVCLNPPADLHIQGPRYWTSVFPRTFRKEKNSKIINIYF